MQTETQPIIRFSRNLSPPDRFSLSFSVSVYDGGKTLGICDISDDRLGFYCLTGKGKTGPLVVSFH